MVLIDGRPLKASELKTLEERRSSLFPPSQFNMQNAVGEILGAYSRQSEKEQEKLTEDEAQVRYVLRKLWEEPKPPEIKDIESAEGGAQSLGSPYTKLKTPNTGISVTNPSKGGGHSFLDTDSDEAFRSESPGYTEPKTSPYKIESQHSNPELWTESWSNSNLIQLKKKEKELS